MPETARFPTASVALGRVRDDKTQIASQKVYGKLSQIIGIFHEQQSESVCLAVTELYLGTLPTPDFLNGLVIFLAYFFVLVVKTVGLLRLPSTDIDRLCGFVFIVSALVEAELAPVCDIFPFFAFLLYCSTVKNGVSFWSSMAISRRVKWYPVPNQRSQR